MSISCKITSNDHTSPGPSPHFRCVTHMWCISARPGAAVSTTRGFVVIQWGECVDCWHFPAIKLSFTSIPPQESKINALSHAPARLARVLKTKNIPSLMLCSDIFEIVETHRSFDRNDFLSQNNGDFGRGDMLVYQESCSGPSFQKTRYRGSNHDA